MPDFGAPIAQDVNVSPQKGIQTLSDLMGLQQRQIAIKQQQQTLETGAALQQTAQAEAQKNQQAMGERQLLQSSMQKNQDPDGNPLLGANGEADPVAMTRFANKFMPLTGQNVIQNIVKTQDDRLKLNDTTRNLGQNYRADMANIVRSSINDPTQDPSKNLDAYVAQQGPNAPPSLTQAAGYAKSLLQNLTPEVPADKRNAALLHLAQQFQPTEATIGEQRPAMASVPGVGQGGGVQLIQTNPQSPIPTGPVGKEIPTGVPPQVIVPPGGVPAIVGGRGPIPTSFGGGGPPPTEQEVTNFGNYQAGLNSRVQAASNVMPQIQQLDRALSSFSDVGGGTKIRAEIAQKLQSFGAPQSIVDAVGRGNLGEIQAAEKYLFQSTLDTLQQGGAGITDNRFAAAAAALPSIDTDPRAKASLIGFIQDRAQRDYAEQQAMSKARKAGTLNPATWQADYQQQLRAGAVPGVPASQVPKPASAPAAAPSGNEGQRSTSRSGKPIIFRNGRWEYQ